MKKLGLLIVFLFVLFTVWAQKLDLSQVDPSQIDFSKVDLSGVKFYFQGPAQFYVSGVGYMGKRYAALLDYDGKGNLAISAPKMATTAGKPQAIDLSMADIALLSDGVMLNDVVIEGYKYSGKLVLSQGTTLAFQSYSRGGQVAATTAKPAMTTAPSKTTTVDVSGYQNQINQLKQQNTKMAQENTSLQQEVSSLKKQLADAGSATPTAKPATMATAPAGAAEPSAAGASEMLANFSSKGQSAYGTWQKSGTSLNSTDTSNLFAKYRFDVSQSANELFYEFTASSSSQGWTGYGMHILINAEKSWKGYGLGSSYLVWVTHDPKKQTDNGYVELYRSYDDVRMISVASQITSSMLPQTGKVKVYVNKRQGIITVYFNGEKLFTYETGMSLPSSSKIALRTLGGPVQFSNVSVKGK